MINLLFVVTRFTSIEIRSESQSADCVCLLLREAVNPLFGCGLCKIAARPDQPSDWAGPQHYTNNDVFAKTVKNYVRTFLWLGLWLRHPVLVTYLNEEIDIGEDAGDAPKVI